MSKKAFLLVLLISLLSLGTMVPAYGEETSIETVPLSFTWDKIPKAGELIGKVYANTTSRQFKVEGASYTNPDDTWAFGDRPVVEIELSAAGGYRFTSSKRDYFSLFGCGAKFKKAVLDSDGNSLIVQVTFPVIDSNLPASTSVSWNNYTAMWDEVEGAKSYEVQLYKDKRLLTTVKAKHDRYDFKAFINVEGVYTFRVRAFGTYKSQDSPWSEMSENRTVDQEDAWYFDNGKWERNRLGRRYVYKTKVYPTNTWRCINDNWYYFNSDGYMQSECYVKSTDMNFYYWLGTNGAWDSDKDTFSPNTSKYSVIKQ